MHGGGALGFGPGRHPEFIPFLIWFPPIPFYADPLLRLEHTISGEFKNGKFVLAIFFDLQKAYDTTWRICLLLLDPFPRWAIESPRPIAMFHPFRITFPLFAVPSVPLGSPVGTSMLRMAIRWLS